MTILTIDQLVDYGKLYTLRAPVGRKFNALNLSNPSFINTRAENEQFSHGKKRWRMADFYKWQRIRLNVLMNSGKPVGDKWSFDHDNRKKVPRSLMNQIPTSSLIPEDTADEQTRIYIEAKYKKNPSSRPDHRHP